MCIETANDEIDRCEPYIAGYDIGSAWATKQLSARMRELKRARWLCNGAAFVVRANEAAEGTFWGIFCRIRPFANRGLWRQFWFDEIGASQEQLSLGSHFYVGFIEGCADCLGHYYYWANDNGKGPVLRACQRTSRSINTGP